MEFTSAEKNLILWTFQEIYYLLFKFTNYSAKMDKVLN